jgi:glycosyltransferase involved in cell wall biosynthesis
MPVLNEEKHLEKAVSSIFDQKGIKKDNIEVILALGPSTDNTNSVAKALTTKFPVRLVQNPTGKTPDGLNLAIAEAKNEVVVRVDAHSQLSPNYTSLALEILNETGAANVGGIMKAVGETPFQQAVAWGYGSRLGLGGGSFHVGGQAGPSDSVYLGVFRREILTKLGGFDEKMLRGQDWELNLRIRQSGQIVWFDPRLEVTYYPRSSLKALAKQFFDTGSWRADLTRNYPNQANLRYFAPPALVLATFIGLISTIFGFFPPLGLVPLGLYLLLIASAALTTKGLNFRARAAILIALPTMHFSWGSGFIAGLFHKR